jgi:hypothetical protein
MIEALCNVLWSAAVDVDVCTYLQVKCVCSIGIILIQIVGLDLELKDSFVNKYG